MSVCIKSNSDTVIVFCIFLIIYQITVMVVATYHWVKMKQNRYQAFSSKTEFVDHEDQGRILGTIPTTLEVRQGGNWERINPVQTISQSVEIDKNMRKVLSLDPQYHWLPLRWKWKCIKNNDNQDLHFSYSFFFLVLSFDILTKYLVIIIDQSGYQSTKVSYALYVLEQILVYYWYYKYA